MRYRTELSFKRHHELPRASTTPDAPSGDAEPWRTPASVEGDAAPGEPVKGTASTEEAATETQVPFYKREIGFRRKKPTADVVADTTVVVAAEEPEVAAPAEVQATAEEAAAPADIADAADSEPAEETSEVVPFYKRELSFRRKRTAVDDEVTEQPEPAEDGIAAAEAPDEAVAAELVAVASASADAPSEPVDASADAPSEPVEAEPDVIAEVGEHEAWVTPAEPEQPAATEAVADQTEDYGDSAADVAETFEEEPAEEDPVDVPIAAAVAVAVEAAASDAPAEPAAPSAAPTGRFGGRKALGAKKAGARKSKGGRGRRIVGLKVGSSQIAAAVIDETDAGHELVQLARRPLAAGVVVDGEVRDADALILALQSFFDDEKLPKKDVRIGVSSNRIGVRTFDIVSVGDETRFDNAVRFRAHELLPVAVQDSVLDYRVLEERANAEGELIRRVLLAVAPRDLLEPYVSVAVAAGLNLAGIDLEALGLLRTFIEPKPLAVDAVHDTAAVVIAIGHESSTLLVAGGSACAFTRVFDWGGSQLQEAIATALEVHPAEATTILKHLSLSGPGRKLDNLDEDARARAVDAVRLRLTPFARELVNSLQFYQTQEDSLGIGGILITGGTSQLEGLDEALHQMIGVDVKVGDPLGRVIGAGEFEPSVEAAIGSMAVPIGLAIEDAAMRGVNLIPQGAVKQQSRRTDLIKIAVPIAVAVPLVALGFLYAGAHGQVSDRQSQLDAVNAEIAALPKPITPNIDASIVGDEAARATAVANVLGGRLAWDGVFRDLARVLPANVWLSQLSVVQPNSGNLADTTVAAAAAPTVGGQAPTPSAVTIDGFTYTQSDVARLLARLATLPSLARVTLTSSQSQVIGTKDVVHFVIVADLNQAGGAS